MIYLDLVNIVVNLVTSSCKSIVSIQLVVNSFPLFSPKEIQSVSIVGWETTPTKSVPLLMEEVEEEEEEEQTEEAQTEEGIGNWIWGNLNTLRST